MCILIGKNGGRLAESGGSGPVRTASGMKASMTAAGGMFRNLVLALAIVAAGGCGYKLRGAASFPPDLDAVRIAGPRDISNALTELFEDGGVRVRSAPDSTAALLRVSDEGFARRVLSVDAGTGKEREFELAYRVTFEVTGAEGGVLVPEQTVSLIRDYSSDAAAVLGREREQDVLHAEMRRDAAVRIVRRIEGSLGRRP